MPKKFCVAYINFFDNRLEQYIVEANDWRSALDKAKPGFGEYVADSESLDAAQEAATNQDWQFAVTELPQ